MRIESFAENIREIESMVSNHAMTLQIKRPNIKEKVQMSRYEVYGHPDARQYVEIGDTLNLCIYKGYAVTFFYDLRRNPAYGRIDCSSRFLSRMEETRWVCPDHQDKEWIYPPLAPGYIPRCYKCAEPLTVSLQAPIPNIRFKIEALPNYQSEVVLAKAI